MSRYKKSLLYLSIIIVSWIIILAAPSLRNMFLAQTIRGSNVLPTVVPNRKLAFAQVAKEHPNNLAIQLNKVDQELSSSNRSALSNSRKTIQKNDDLFSKQFPHAVLPIAYSLNKAASWMKPIRSTRPYYNYAVATGKLKNAKPFHPNKTRNYAQAQWQHVIALCKRGQQLAPGNAYFDLIEAYWQFAEFHDEAAWKAIERALKKSDFNNYIIASRQSRLQAYRIAYGRPLMWEEISQNAVNPTSQFGNMTALRHLLPWMRWTGTKAQIDGNHQLALKRYSQTFHVAYLRYRDGATFLDNSLASSAVTMALRGPQNAGTKPDKNLPTEMGKYSKVNQQADQTYSAFEKYVVTQHRPDMERFTAIAKAARHQYNAISDERKKAQKSYLADSFTGAFLWQISVLLMWLLIGGGAVWLISSFITKVLLRSKQESNNPITEIEFLRGAFSFAALPASLVLILGEIVSAIVYALQKDNDVSYLYFAFRNSPFSSLSTSVWLVLFGVFTAMLFGVAYSLRRAAQRHQKPDAPKVLLRIRVFGVLGSLLFVIFWAVLGNGEWSFINGSGSLFNDLHSVIYGMLYGISNGIPDAGKHLINWELALLGVITGLLIYCYNTARCWRNTDDKKAAFHDFWHLLSGSAFRWLTIGSVLYLLALAIAIPIRAPLHKRTLIKVNQGEMALFHNNPTNALSLLNNNP